MIDESDDLDSFGFTQSGDLLVYPVSQTGTIKYKLNVLLRAIEEEFEGKKPRENAEAARLTYEKTQIGDV